jgi:hypothetical protein
MTGTLLLAVATSGFVIAAALHLSSFTSLATTVRDGAAVMLWVGAFGLLMAMVLRMRRAEAPSRAWGRFRIYDWRALGSLVPPPIRGVTFALVLYVLMNFALSLTLAGGVTATATNGRFYLDAAGAARREVSREEYEEHHRLTTRLASGHLLLFYVVPLIYFRFVDPRLAELRR